MKCQKFTRYARAGETEFKQGLRDENGTTNHLLSLIINEKSKLPRFPREGEKLNSNKD